MKRGKNKKVDERQLPKNDNKRLLYILVAAFAAIAIVKILLSLKFYSPFILNDEIFYDSLAKNILNGKLYPTIGDTRSPGYPIVLSIAYLFSGDRGTIYHIMLAISALISTAIIFPSYFILKKYCPGETSLLGSIAIAVLPFMAIYSFTIMSEVLFIPLYMFSIWALIEAYGSDSVPWQFLASASAVYLYMTRSNGLAVIIAFVATFIYYLITNRKKEGLCSLIAEKSMLIVSFLILFSGWILYSMAFLGSIFSPGAILFIIGIAVILVAAYYITSGKLKLPAILSSKMGISVSLISVIVMAAIGYLLLGSGLSQGSYYNFGSAFNIESVSIHLLDPLKSVASFSLFLDIIANDTGYLFVGSFFILAFIIVYYILLWQDKKIDLSSPMSIAGFYTMVSLIFLILSAVALRFYGGADFIILGRYIDPIIPAIFLFGIILLSRLNALHYKKHVNVFALIFVLLTLGTITVLEYNLAIIQGFIQFTSNEALYYMEWAYHNSFPEVIVMAFALIVLAMLYLSINDKRYTSIFILFIIISSAVFSVGIYNNIVNNSNVTRGDPITTFLTAHSDSNTTLILYSDDNDPNTLVNEIAFYSFWNAGDTVLNTQNMDALKQYTGHDSYVVAKVQLPYVLEADDGHFLLYKMNVSV